ncbi:MAG TPA: glycosyltransferase [Bradyrhizobium sp.]|nr:glycosyltransferase [Bradyrhizobium sp.]
MSTEVDKPRVLIFSLRNIYGKAHFRCPHFEFEDIICEIDSADLLAPKVDPTSARASFATRLAFRAPVALNPGLPKISVKKRYDILFTVCGHPQDLIMFNAVSNVKDNCAISVCLLDELWIREIPLRTHFLKILAKFDVVMLYYSQTAKPLSETIGRRCVFMPPGVDAISFCPYPTPPQRVIDVLSIGRRSEITHQRLLDMVRKDGLFYLHDSIAGIQTINSREHRALFANCAKRTRYFIVNPGIIDQPERRGNQIEIGNRYFEGAASGTIMVGERPNNEAFQTLFDWPDAVTQLPYNSTDIDLVIKDLDRDPERQERIRRTGVLEALKKHDWAYRWEKILETVGLQPKQQLQERKERLRRLAEVVSQH